MAHPQNSHRGLFAKDRIDVGANQITNSATGLKFNLGLALSGETDYITQNSTAAILPTGLAISAQTDYITQNSSGVVFPTGITLSAQDAFLTANTTATLLFPVVSSLPATREVGGLVFVSNSTGKAFAYHSTATTWLYMSGTSVLA